MSIQNLIDFLKKNNAKKFVLDIGQLLFRNILLLFISFPVSIVIAAVLTREQMGNYQYVLSIFSTLSFINLPGLGYMITQQTAHGAHGIVKQVFLLRIRTSLISAAVFVVFGGYFYFISQETELAWCFFAAALPMPITSVISSSYSSYLLGHRDYALNARLNVMTGLVSAITTMLIAWFTRSPIYIILGSSIVLLIAHAVAHLYTFRVYVPNSVPGSQESIRYGSRTSLINVMPTIGAQLDTILLKGLYTSDDVAVLGMASLPMDKSKAVYGVLLEYMVPQILSKSGKELFRKADRGIILYTLYTIGITGVIALFTPLLFHWFYPNYVDVIPLAILATFTQIMTAPAAIIETTLNAQHKLKQTGILRLILFISELISNFVLISTFSVIGAFLSRYLMGLLRSIIAFYFYLQNRRAAMAEVPAPAAEN